jgi:hypothetical protein
MVLNATSFTEPNPYNPAGNLRTSDVQHVVSFDLTTEGAMPRPERTPDGRIIVRAFTDLKRHNLCDAEVSVFCNEKVIQAGVPTSDFLTRKLWDCGSSAPWGHRGDLTTLTEAIEAHGGEASATRKAFEALSKSERDEVIEFLKSLRVLPAGTPQLVVDQTNHPVDKAQLIQNFLPGRVRTAKH